VRQTFAPEEATVALTTLVVQNLFASEEIVLKGISESKPSVFVTLLAGSSNVLSDQIVSKRTGMKDAIEAVLTFLD
jgi:hypothetical protein